MALTEQDLHSIKHLFDDKFERIDKQFAAVRGDIDNLAIATAQQFEVIDQRFAAMDARFDAVEEDLADIKSVVGDHNYRITRLERKAA